MHMDPKGSGFTSRKELVFLAVPLCFVIIILSVLVNNRMSQSLRPSLTLGSFDPAPLLAISGIVLLLVMYELRLHGERAARLLMTGIAVAGILSGLILLQFWTSTSTIGQATFYLVAAPVAYLGLYASLRYYRGSFSEKKAVALLSVSTSLLGCLLGLFFPVIFAVLLLLSLAILDVVFVENDLLRKVVGLRRVDSVLSITTLPISVFGIGLGDLLAYSILATASFVSEGAYVAAASILMMLLGIMLTLRIARNRQLFAGLPIPIMLGLTPTILAMVL